MAWTNNDGLTIYFADDADYIGNGGEYKTGGLEREIEVVINLADLTETETVQSRVRVPHGKVLGKVQYISDTAAAGGVAIDVGFVRQKDNTEVDYDGAIAALPLASINAEGKRGELTAGVTNAGALVGKVMEADDVMLISASRTTAAAFTAGRVRLKFFWYKKTPTT